MKSIFAALALASALFAAPGLAAEAGVDCHVAAYRLADGRIVDIAPLDGGGLRWRLLDGRTGKLTPSTAGGWTSSLGWTREPDGVKVSFGDCNAGVIGFDGIDGKALAFDVVDTRFQGSGVTLAGRLVMPKGRGKVTVMVVGQGSEKDSALLQAWDQRMYPAHGVGVFVFDKRGTGASSGSYTQNFDLLASDAAAALLEARRLAGPRAGRVGFEGDSQAGWVLPLAASKTKADFVIVGYGIAASPLVEDRTETLQDLASKGWGADVQAKAVEVTDATAGVMVARFQGGFETFNAIVAKYRNEPWFKDLKGQFTGEMVRYTEAQIRAAGPSQDDGTTWEYDAMAGLRRLDAPLLWLLAGDDTGGAGPETRSNLLTLKHEGRPVTVVNFPATEHGLMEFRTSVGGERVQTRYAEGSMRIRLDFARDGRLKGPYGKAEILPRSRRMQKRDGSKPPVFQVPRGERRTPLSKVPG